MRTALDPNELMAAKAELTAFKQRCRAIADAIGEKKHLGPDERAAIEAMYRSLKSDLQAAAQRGTLADNGAAPTAVDSTFFAPAVRKAHAALKPATNSHPLKSDWLTAVQTASSTLSLALNRSPA